MGRIYRRRAESWAVCEPQALLDVGTGHAHFCLVARRRWPAATVDGLDLERLGRRGRPPGVDRHRLPGQLPRPGRRAAPVLRRRHHAPLPGAHREPRRELAAAAKVLEPGGHLVVEVPDTASPWARRLGRWWYSWFQPQHQHFVTCENLVEALAGEGLEVVSVERGEANQGGDLYTAVVLGMQALAPSPHAPWLPPPTPGAPAPPPGGHRRGGAGGGGGRGPRPGHGRPAAERVGARPGQRLPDRGPPELTDAIAARPPPAWRAVPWPRWPPPTWPRRWCCGAGPGAWPSCRRRPRRLPPRPSPPCWPWRGPPSTPRPAAPSPRCWRPGTSTPSTSCPPTCRRPGRCACCAACGPSGCGRRPAHPGRRARGGGGAGRGGRAGRAGRRTPRRRSTAATWCGARSRPSATPPAARACWWRRASGPPPGPATPAGGSSTS